jgi:hypothetical protein
MSDTPPITVRSLTNISTEQARDARARAWIYVLDIWNKKAAGAGGPDDGTKVEGDSADVSIVPH